MKSSVLTKEIFAGVDYKIQNCIYNFSVFGKKLILKPKPFRKINPSRLRNMSAISN